MIKKFIYKIINRLTKFIENELMIKSIYSSQKYLAFKDSQEFIYKNSELNTLTFSDHFELREHCIKNCLKEGMLAEFGVFKGKSINFFAKKLIEQNDIRTIYGFDSFEGFSEEWSGVDKIYGEKFHDQKGKLPEVEKNVKLIPGFIETSLEKYLSQNEIKNVSFIHIDTDTYSPAKVILTLLKPFIKKGTIILFDELCGYPNWRSHEFKALTEVFDNEDYEFIGFAQSHSKANLIKAAIRIL